MPLAHCMDAFLQALACGADVIFCFFEYYVALFAASLETRWRGFVLAGLQVQSNEGGLWSGILWLVTLSFFGPNW